MDEIELSAEYRAARAALLETVRPRAEIYDRLCTGCGLRDCDKWGHGDDCPNK
jgi:hypothetical protein